MKRYEELKEELLLYEMTTMWPSETGLPFYVWYSPKGNAKHDVRVKVTFGEKMIPGEMVSVALRPEIRVIPSRLSNKLKGKNLKLLKDWLALNKDILIDCWEGRISQLQAGNKLKPLSKKK